MTPRHSTCDALAWHRPRIAEQLGFSTTAAAQASINGAMQAQGTEFDPADVRAMELDRLAPTAAGGVEAIKGDLKAVETAQKLTEARVRLAGIAARGELIMTESFDQTIEALATELGGCINRRVWSSHCGAHRHCCGVW